VLPTSNLDLLTVGVEEYLKEPEIVEDIKSTANQHNLSWAS